MSQKQPDTEWLTLLRSKKRLDREKGLNQLKLMVTSSPVEGQCDRIEGELLGLILSLVGPWEERHGGLLAAGIMIQTGAASQKFCEKVKGEIPLFLEDSESRVRMAAGEVLEHLCRHCGPEVYIELQPVLTSGIKDNLERDQDLITEHPQLMEKLTGRQSPDPVENERFFMHPTQPRSPSATQIFHDTAGWKSLETYMLALQHAVIGCGSKFEPFITTDLLQLIFTALGHANRFVRETGFKVISSIVQCPGLSEVTTTTHWPVVADNLARGLADNWSQVRMSASVATREFLLHLKAKKAKEMFFPALLPAMCLNRYYVAEGVRLYSQESWRLITENRGVELVEQFIKNVVDFYISQSQAANHAVREAACSCIAELGTKVSKDSLRSYIGQLITVLLECFKDDSWPVRDAACLACGNFVACYPEECRNSLDELFPLFFSNLEDSIPSVRQGGAVAIANVVKAYGAEVEEKVFTILRERLPLVASQPSSTSGDMHPGIDPSPAVFGVVRRVEDNYDAAHTDQQMYSCGSLAPKMRRGGCMDSHFHKPSQPWEKSEGCVHLLAELSQQKPYTDKVSSLLPLVAESARHKHYSQHYSYLETVFKQLPVIARALGKRSFKRHLELFLDPMFYALSCESALAKTAATDCLIVLTQLLGRMIMRGRIEQHNLEYTEVFDRTVQ